MKLVPSISLIAFLSVVFGCSNSKTNTVTPTPAPTSGVSTYVGNGTPGLVNGTGTGAELSAPVGIVVDVLGNLYISEKGNNLIRKVAPGGVVTTLVGTGTAGYKDGPVATAQFNDPEGMVIDGTGNLFVADAGNNVIRKITPDGQVSTYAGNGKAGLINGSATGAEFSTPKGLAIDKARNLYVADYGNNVIREISAIGTVTTYAGNGTPGLVNGSAASAEFQNPTGIAIDGSYEVFVAEAGNSDIREILQSGKVSTFVSGLPNPVWVTLDGAGNMYASCTNSTIQFISATGKISTYAGSGTPSFTDGPLLLSGFNNPLGLIADNLGEVIVCDNGNNRLRVVKP